MSLPVSIIICTRGRSQELGRTLASLRTVSVPDGFEVELVIVENRSENQAESLSTHFSHPHIAARYLFEPAPGKSNALNRGIRESGGDILLFTDDDVRFPPDWIGRLCEPIRAKSVDAVAGGVVIAPHLLRPWMDRTMRAWLASTADYLSPEHPSEMCGANMAVSRRAIDRIGGYDLEIGPGVTNGGEESLLSWQLKRAGFELAGALDVQVEHHFDPLRLNYGSWLAAARLKGRTRAYLMHHWHHRSLRCPRLKQRCLEAKLVLRRGSGPLRHPEEEGILPWELSYVEDIALCTQYLVEQDRIPNYPAPPPLSSPSELSAT